MAARPSSAGARIESALAPPGQPAVGEGGGHSWPTCTRSRAAEGVAGVGGTYGEGEGEISYLEDMLRGGEGRQWRAHRGACCCGSSASSSADAATAGEAG